MAHYVRRMRPQDIERVLRIDREAFPSEWPPNLRRELENGLAHYIVACRADAPPGTAAGPHPDGPGGLFSRLKRLLLRRGRPAEQHLLPGPNECITGFAGIWVMADEAHITTIATAREYRRQGIGELLLQAVIDLATHLRARLVTLEVRASNRPAQALYTKYGFKEVGLRRGYYTDNREDAIIMTTERLDSPAFRAHFCEKLGAYRQRWGDDRYGLFYHRGSGRP